MARTLARDDIEVVDLTPHPAERLALIEAALAAGKHVLSQKPFVLDLDEGARLCDLADAKGVRLAVNQNGRWAPHLAWMREAVHAGLIGGGAVLRRLDPLGPRLDRRHAVRGDRRPDPLRLRRALVRLPGEPAACARPRSLRARRAPPARRCGRRCSPRRSSTSRAGRRRSPSTGRRGSARRTGPSSAAARGRSTSRGPDLGKQEVTLATAAGMARPRLEGTWFKEGFAGTMGALLKAVEDGAEPPNAARGNLDALALVFAAIASARRGEPVAPGSVRSLAAARGAVDA